MPLASLKDKSKDFLATKFVWLETEDSWSNKLSFSDIPKVSANVIR